MPSRYTFTIEVVVDDEAALIEAGKAAADRDGVFPPKEWDEKELGAAAALEMLLTPDTIPGCSIQWQQADVVGEVEKETPPRG